MRFTVILPPPPPRKKINASSKFNLDSEACLTGSTTIYEKTIVYELIKKYVFQNNFVMEELIDKLNRSFSVWGNRNRLHLGKNTSMVNTLFNTSSGDIYIGDYTFTGHNVSIITGCHDINKQFELRQTTIPQNRNIVIGKGCWLCSGSMILGPCQIGNNSVIAAGSVVLPNTVIKDNELWAGVPAVRKKTLSYLNPQNSGSHGTKKED